MLTKSMGWQSESNCKEEERNRIFRLYIFDINLRQMMKQKVLIAGREYKICGMIGEGGAAVVYLAKDNRDNSYALKMVKNYNDPIIKQMVDAQIRIQKEFEGNKFVIQYIGYEKMDKSVYIVLELGECSLRNWIDASREISQAELISVLCDVCEGLRSIHNKKMIHRDIKPQNIIRKDNVYKITDFGVSCDKEEDENMSGTPLYWAPEILFQENMKFDNKVDVWSFGVTMFEVYFKVNPFCPDKSLTFRQAIQEIKKNIKKLTPRFSVQKFVELLKQKKMMEELAFVERKIKNTDKNLIEVLCSFFEPKPEARPDIDLLLVLFESLRNAVQVPEIRKTQKNPKFTSWQAIPEDIRLFCRAKDLFYELSAYYATKLYDKVLFGLEIGIWYLEGANYGGSHYIFLDKMNFIKQYRKPAKQLWNEVKTLLSEYYFYLKFDEQVKNFQKLDQLRLHILACSIWKSIMNDDIYFCKMVTEVTGFQIEHPLKMFQYLQLYSDRNIMEIQDRLISRFYV